MDSLHDEIKKRRQALAELDEYEDPHVQRDEEGRRIREDYGHEEVFGEDDLDVADRVAQSLPMGDSLSQKVALRGENWQNLNETAMFVRNNPASCLQGTLGGQQAVSSGDQIQVANWGGSDAETVPVTVTFAPVQQIASLVPSAVKHVRPFGIVQFGTRGFLVKAEVDIATGIQFVVSGSMVTLQVCLNGPGAPNPQYTMLLAGMLSFHPVIRTTPITRTLYIDNLTGGGNTTVDVPAFARNLMVWRATITEAYTITFLDNFGAISYTFALAVNAVMLDPIPLSGEVVRVKVTDVTGNTTSLNLIFGLSF